MEHRLSRTSKIIIIFLAYIIHFFFICLLFFSPAYQHFSQSYKAHSLAEIPSPSPVAHQPNSSHWAATKARQSQFGAPVFFHDDSSPQSPTSTDVTQSTSDNNKSETMDTPEKHKDSETETFQNTALLPHPLPAAQESNQSLYGAKNESLTTIESHTQHTLSHVPINVTQSTSHHSPSASSPAHSPQKTINLAHITKGFLEQLSHGGTHTVSMRGDKNKQPTDEQLKHERYVARLQWCIQNSMKIHEHRYTHKTTEKTSLDIFLSLTRDGIIKELQLVRSSGLHELDQFMLFVFEDASAGFPSVPAFFKKDLYAIIFTVKINESMDSSRVNLYRQYR